jgi:hypothetical protein
LILESTTAVSVVPVPGLSSGGDDAVVLVEMGCLSVCLPDCQVIPVVHALAHARRHSSPRRRSDAAKDDDAIVPNLKERERDQLRRETT